MKTHRLSLQNALKFMMTFYNKKEHPLVWVLFCCTITKYYIISVVNFISVSNFTKNSFSHFSHSIVNSPSISPVSIRPDLVYNTDEIYCLCRFHHDRIDNYRDPVTDEIIGKEKHEEWWNRIKATRNSSGLDIGVKELPEFFDFDDQ